MINVSLCLIVKNEEAYLERCLSSFADLVEEIIIVDTGSTDRTKEIASAFTDRIFDFPWIDDFSAARNYSFKQATQDYIMWVDADDVISEEDRIQFKELKENLPPDIDSVTMLYHLGRDVFGNSTFSLRRNRLVRREAGFRWIGAVHEYLEVGGRIDNSDISIQHLGSNKPRDSRRNLSIYEKQLASGKEMTPRDQYYYANELKDHSLFYEASSYYEAFLQEGKGWVEDNIAACGQLADCYHELGDQQSSMKATLQTLIYDSPRPETCCRMGNYFVNKNHYDAAIIWFKMAINLPLSANFAGFNNRPYSTWLPHLQLCICYDKLGRYELASQHNELALKYRPMDTSLLANRYYFTEKLEQLFQDSAKTNEDTSHE